MSKPVGPYRPVVRAGDFAFSSGQIGIKDGALEDGFEAQVRQALSNLESVLKAEGLSLANVVKTTLFLTDMSNYAAANDIYVSAFTEDLPARSAVGVDALPLGALFEIEAVAHVG
jgi:2-iminobutanoate/2-iminopropanoate deaminase